MNTKLTFVLCDLEGENDDSALLEARLRDALVVVQHFPLVHSVSHLLATIQNLNLFCSSNSSTYNRMQHTENEQGIVHTNAALRE